MIGYIMAYLFNQEKEVNEQARKQSKHEAITRQVKKWRIIAQASWEKYLFNKLKNEGVIACPRSFILELFNREDFEHLCQTNNKTYYKIKEKNS